MKIQNPFRLGLFGGLGVLVAVLIGTAVGNLATIITYVGAALFLALGIDPAVSFLERHKVPRPLAILIVLVVILGVVVGFVFAIVPVIVEQVGRLIEQVPDLISTLTNQEAVQEWWSATIPWLSYDQAVKSVTDFLNSNIGSITAATVNTVFGIASGAFGLLIVVILMLYFVASLSSIKRALYSLVPATKRETFIDLSEQITSSVGRFVMGQVTLGATNGVVSFLFLTVLGGILGEPIQYAALLAFIAFLGSMIPLVGTLTASILITSAVWLFDGPPAVFVVGIWYLAYMQIEAYVISPRIMNRAVKVPGVLVVVAALAGGTLLGLLGALVAIPFAAAVLLIIKQVIIPRQNAL
ncbi:MAG: AI-2E family transporter [Actinomycetales bacterium]|nr:AI-2E family transporter [Actinomycetales bacterium]